MKRCSPPIPPRSSRSRSVTARSARTLATLASTHCRSRSGRGRSRRALPPCRRSSAPTSAVRRRVDGVAVGTESQRLPRSAVTNLPLKRSRLGCLALARPGRGYLTGFWDGYACPSDGAAAVNWTAGGMTTLAAFSELGVRGRAVLRAARPLFLGPPLGDSPGAGKGDRPHREPNKSPSSASATGSPALRVAPKWRRVGTRNSTPT